MVRGKAPFQLYSLGTPNGFKCSILLEELGIDYDAHVVNIGKGEQFSKGFVEVNPNSKIPCAVDYDGESEGGGGKEREGFALPLCMTKYIIFPLIINIQSIPNDCTEQPSILPIGPDGKPIHLFESASICIYLAEKL